MSPVPGPGVAPDRVIAAVITQRPQLLEQPDQRQPLAHRGAGVLRQKPIELRLPAPELRSRLNLPLIRKRRLARSQHLPNRVARHLQITRDLPEICTPCSISARCVVDADRLDRLFVESGSMTAHDSRVYLAWTNSLARLLRPINRTIRLQQGPSA
jgi:hypothetical protein